MCSSPAFGFTTDLYLYQRNLTPVGARFKLVKIVITADLYRLQSNSVPLGALVLVHYHNYLILILVMKVLM